MSPTDARALVDRIDKYQACPGSRALIEILIYFFDLSEKDPKKWPVLETILAGALAQARRETWEEAAKEIERRSFLQPYTLSAGKELAAWCRQRAKEQP